MAVGPRQPLVEACRVEERRNGRAQGRHDDAQAGDEILVEPGAGHRYSGAGVGYLVRPLAVSRVCCAAAARVAARLALRRVAVGCPRVLENRRLFFPEHRQLARVRCALVIRRRIRLLERLNALLQPAQAPIRPPPDP